MKLSRKIQLAMSSIASISRHDDEDAAVRRAALKRLEDFIVEENKEIDQRIAAKVAAMNKAEDAKAEDAPAAA